MGQTWAGGAGIRSTHPRPSTGTVWCWDGGLGGSPCTQPGCKRGERGLWVLGSAGRRWDLCLCAPCPLSSPSHHGCPWGEEGYLPP